LRAPYPALALAAALALTAARPALAAEAGAPATPQADPGAMFQIMGPATCAQWPKSGAISSAGKAVPLNWTLGFLSGWASLGKLGLLDLIDAEQVDEWMTRYCGEHPTATLPLAARQLERELEAKLPAPVAETPSEPLFLPTNPTPEGLAAAAGKPPPATAPAKRPAPRRKGR
jgi:hypothetical protein